MKSLSRLLATPRTAAYHAPPSMGFSRQEYWSGAPSPSLNTYTLERGPSKHTRRYSTNGAELDVWNSLAFARRQLGLGQVTSEPSKMCLLLPWVKVAPLLYFSHHYFKLSCLLTLLLLLSRFSHAQLCLTPETAAHQAPLSLEFSRQEHWSGLPFPSPIHESEKGKRSRS